MSPFSFVVILLALSSLAFRQGKRKAFGVATGGGGRMHSRPGYCGMLTTLWCALLALIVFFLWLDPVRHSSGETGYAEPVRTGEGNGS